MMNWRCVLELDSKRNPISGSYDDLTTAIRRGADLRIGTEFIHNEHIDVRSTSSERIREVAEFRVTYCIDHRWSAGIMSLRQPIELPDGFGPRPSMSFFLYNQDGTQAIARPHLDGQTFAAPTGSSLVSPPVGMPKYHAFDAWDSATNAPAHNFVYDFDIYRYCVDDSWQEVLRHSSNGQVLSGSFDKLVEAFSSGCSIKLGIEGICADLANDSQPATTHELFIQGGSAYYYTDRKLLIIGSHPIVRVAPAIPMRYASRNWDFGWLMVRTDGHVVYRRCDPYTLKFSDHASQNAIRWFVR